MKLESNLALVLGVVAGLGLAGCGSSTLAVDGSGGAQGTGGASKNGGFTTSGGSMGTGGTTSSGGSTSRGGATTAGGASGFGGAVGTGGAATSGGAMGTGGSIGSGGSSATGGAQSDGGTTSAGGTVATGGATRTVDAAATGGSTGTADADVTGGSTSTGGSTAMGGTQSIDGATSTGGSTGANTFVPACASFVTAAGVAPTKAGTCTAADPQLCYKTCGPESKGFKSETCAAGAYVEQPGCSFPVGDYSCYKIPTTTNATCPTVAPQASTACAVAACVVCGGATGYLDSSGAAKTGYCVCPASTTGTAKWSCASATAWPCPAGTGC
jgi:hypothetical protein